MDDVVNAGTRDWRCYHAPSMIYFGNDDFGRSLTLLSFGSLYITRLQVADSAQCQAGGCARCAAPPVDAVCCSLCHPDEFLHISFIEGPSRSRPTQTAPPPTARCLDKKYVPSPADMDLRTALHNFRKERMELTYGRALLRNLGPGSIMSNDILQSIVDATHAGRVTCIGDVKREVKWARVDELGNEVLQLVLVHAPPPLPTPPLSGSANAPLSRQHPIGPYTSLPLQGLGRSLSSNISSSNATIPGPPEVAQAKPKRQYKCRACGAVGHIGRRISTSLRENPA